jgi:hypothetical protein
MNRIRLATALLAFLPLTAFAHHGQDFLVVESPTIPHPGDGYFLANAEFAPGGDIELEPSLFWGLSPRWAFELHAHEMREPGEGWGYEATAPAVHLLLSDPAKHHGTRVGLSAEYEIARDREAPDNVVVRLSVQRQVGAWNWAGNLSAEKADNNKAEGGYAFGVRHALSTQWTGTLEAHGYFGHAADTEVLGGLVWENGQAFAFKAGLGAERSDEGNYRPVLHLGLVVALRAN